MIELFCTFLVTLILLAVGQWLVHLFRKLRRSRCVICESGLKFVTRETNHYGICYVFECPRCGNRRFIHYDR